MVIESNSEENKEINIQESYKREQKQEWYNEILSLVLLIRFFVFD